MTTLARQASGQIERLVSLVRPFSNFQFLDAQPELRTAGVPLYRMFSEARRAGARTLVIESLSESEETADESQVLAVSFPDYRSSRLRRLTFWTADWHHDRGSPANFHPSPEALLGYAIVRTDDFAGHAAESHVFESVFRNYAHFDNSVPAGGEFELAFGGMLYRLPGVMYCQQNARTKACAQVALRSLLATRFGSRPILYSETNRVAGQATPSHGLDVDQIRLVIDHFGLRCHDLDYTTDEFADAGLCAEELPYTKLLYAGLESGCGGLLGFQLSGIDATGNTCSPGRHLLPFFGHTFNQDTWAPRAPRLYFHVGEATRYIPSHAWVGNFIGHDDNLGSNLCLPKDFLSPRQVTYVAALLPPSMQADPLKAEVAAVEALYTLFDLVPPDLRQAFWYRALIDCVERQDVVLRTHALTAAEYVSHLATLRDWDGNAGDVDPTMLTAFLPNDLWMIELSLPEVFATNYGKLGEVVIGGDADIASWTEAPDPAVQETVLKAIAFVRLPGVILVHTQADGQRTQMVPASCSLSGHCPLYRLSALPMTTHPHWCAVLVVWCRASSLACRIVDRQAVWGRGAVRFGYAEPGPLRPARPVNKGIAHEGPHLVPRLDRALAA